MPCQYNKGKVPSGVRKFPDGSMWVPSEKPRVVGFQPNPSKWETWGKPSKATLYVGLTVGRATRGLPKGFLIPDDMLYGIVFRVRTGQVGFDYGGSFVRQHGHFIPKKAREIGSELKRREESMQVVLFPAPPESWKKFRRNVRDLATTILNLMGQKTIIAEFVHEGVLEEVGQFAWKP